MNAPTSRSMARLKRVGRCLKLRPRVVWEYLWLTPYDVLDVSAYANWCGCKLSRKSIFRRSYRGWQSSNFGSGGAIVVGSHNRLLQNTSAESELYVVVQGACEGLGATTLLKDLGVAGVKARMHLDAILRQ